MNTRQNKILDLISESGETSVSRLSEILKVSTVTIRQDLNLLEEEGLLKRIHGGAVLRDPEDISIRLGFNYETKRHIAVKAAEFVDEGETVLLESGSINALLARELVKKGNVTIITTNVYIARQFRKNKDAKIILPGGIYQHESESMVGPLVKSCLDQLYFKKAFIGIDGFTPETGFTSRDMMRADISNYITGKSVETFVVTDATKFGQTEFIKICRPEEIDHIITDEGIDSRYREYFNDKSVDLILAAR